MEPSDNLLRDRRAPPALGGRRDYDKPKGVLQSRTVICAFVGMAASIAGFFGYAVSCEEQMQIGDNLSAIVTLLAAFGAFIFRLLATRRIG